MNDIDFTALDVQFAALMTRLAGRDDPALALAASLASRATSNGDVCVHLAEFAGQTVRAEETDKSRLEARATEPITAPPLERWLSALRAAPVVGRPGEFRPLILDDSGRLYLYRYWNYEKRLAENLLARATDAEDVDDARLHEALDRLFPNPADAEQKLAAAMAVLRRFCVISGGPGTGKTTTVVKILALLADQARGRKLAIGLAAPTGKAAARVQDAIRRALAQLRLDPAVTASMPAEAFTLHRLLGARPDSVYCRYNRENPLPLDVLVVDEASMADLALAAKLADALTARTRLILLGDKDQLASVEAGAVLGDICAYSGLSPGFAERLSSIANIPKHSLSPMLGERGAAGEGKQSLSNSIAILTRSYRFGPDSGIGTLARLVNAGQGAEALALIQSGKHKDVAWRTMSPAELVPALDTVVRERLRDYFEMVRTNRAPAEIFERFNAFRVLCAHRTGRMGVIAVNRMIEDTLGAQRGISTREPWYAGRPVMIARNDYNLRLFNGDVGIALPDPDADWQLKVFFPAAGAGRGRSRASAGGSALDPGVRRGDKASCTATDAGPEEPASISETDAGRGADGSPPLRKFAPARLPEHETVYAMTIHKSQGSEFGDVLMVLPNEPSAIMSRELVYTGITRAMRCVEIWGTEATFVDAVQRRLARASALRERLWGG
ncbi:MAG: exodeoxyribonuclease V subunit alpha [Burkholderiales bacterium]